MTPARAPFAILLPAVAAALLAACGGKPARRTFEFSGPTMGTTFSVKVVTGGEGLSEQDRREVDGEIRHVLERINTLMSTWDAGSELSRFNQSASLDPFPLSVETFEVFQWSLDLGALTGGAFDVTVAPLVDAWGFGPGGRREHVPADEEIAALRSAVGHGHIELDPGKLTVRKRRPDVRCDFSGVAPGYAVDAIHALLETRGFTDFLIDVGGELRALGANDAGEPWRIAIERPQEQGRVVERMVAVSDRALATSGDYRNYHEVDGVRVAHIVDPRTGRPISHALASVTVVDELAVRADALSTALMVLGPEEGMALAERLDVPAFFIVREGQGGFTGRATRRFEELVNR